MFESSRRMAVSFCAVMAILGQNAASFVVARELDSGVPPPGSHCRMTAIPTRPPQGQPSPRATARRAYVMARYVAGDEDDAPLDKLPPALASEIKNIDV